MKVVNFLIFFKILLIFFNLLVDGFDFSYRRCCDNFGLVIKCTYFLGRIRLYLCVELDRLLDFLL